MIRLVLSTINDLEDANLVARHLVSEKLAACVNILPKMTSVYHWRGTLEETLEHLIIIKTSEDRVETLMNRLKELHPYDLPEILAVPVESGLPSYLKWVFQETRN